jgi:hypothetical protein
VEEFGPEAIHNMNNLIPIEYSVHMQISAYYSSIQPFTDGLTVRGWLSTQSFEDQKSFGIWVLQQYGVLQ